MSDLNTAPERIILSRDEFERLIAELDEPAKDLPKLRALIEKVRANPVFADET